MTNAKREIGNLKLFTGNANPELAQEIADYLGMKQPQYSRYERGYRDIPTDVLIKLAKLYNTSTDYILGLTNQSKSKHSK